jgi:hypothetical protein
LAIRVFFLQRASAQSDKEYTHCGAIWDASIAAVDASITPGVASLIQPIFNSDPTHAISPKGK